MIIRNLRVENLGRYVRIATDVVHEDAFVPTVTPFYDVPLQHEGKLVASYEPFLIAAFQAAQMHGERRVLVEGEICPTLADGLQNVLAWHRSWYGPRFRSANRLDIEAPPRKIAETGGSSGIFLSGGVDSMFTLYENRQTVPSAHPASIRYAFFVEGFDLRNPGTIEANRERTARLAERCGLELIAVRSNAPALETDTPYWFDRAGAACFCSVVHLLRGTIRKCYFAANLDFDSMVPHTLHPATDQWYSSADIEICNDGMETRRVDKVRRLAEWDIAQSHLRVCFESSERNANCGRCEKCVRTMLALEAAGALRSTLAFPRNELSADEIRSMRLRYHHAFEFYVEMVEPLRAAGRGDLADAVVEMLREAGHYFAWREGRTLKGRIRNAVRKRLAME